MNSELEVRPDMESKPDMTVEDYNKMFYFPTVKEPVGITKEERRKRTKAKKRIKKNKRK